MVANGKQADVEQKLMADKANLKSVIRERVSSPSTSQKARNMS